MGSSCWEIFDIMLLYSHVFAQGHILALCIASTGRTHVTRRHILLSRPGDVLGWFPCRSFLAGVVIPFITKVERFLVSRMCAPDSELMQVGSIQVILFAFCSSERPKCYWFGAENFGCFTGNWSWSLAILLFRKCSRICTLIMRFLVTWPLTSWCMLHVPHVLPLMAPLLLGFDCKGCKK